MDTLKNEAQKDIARANLNDYFSRWNPREERIKLDEAGIKSVNLTHNPLLTIRHNGTRKAEILPEDYMGLCTINLRVGASGMLIIEEQSLDNRFDDFGKLTDKKRYSRDSNGDWFGMTGSEGFNIEKDEVLNLLLDHGFDRERLQKRFSAVIEKAKKEQVEV